MARFAIGDTVWLWRGSRNYAARVLHVFEGRTPTQLANYPNLTYYVTEYETPVGPIVEIREEFLVCGKPGTSVFTYWNLNKERTDGAV